MTVARRVALLLAVVVMLAMAGSLAVHTLATRQALSTELAARNQDAAAALALVLSLQPDEAAMRASAAAQMARGAYRRVVLRRPDGSLVLDLLEPLGPRHAPDWFVRGLPLSPAPGTATVLREGAAVALLSVESRVAWALDALWQACAVTALLLAALAALAAALAVGLLRGWQRPLQATVAQAQALEQGRFVEAEEPRLPELRVLTRSMNAMVRRLREVFAAQAEQVQVLQRQAQVDSVTGLPLRRHFVARLQTQLAEPGGPGAALILVRVLHLDAINERLGHEATDRLLVSAAGLLLAYVERVPGTFAGRLNGSDFALCLPVTGLAAETANSLHATLLAAPALHAGGAQIVVGGVDGLLAVAAGAALAQADAALAQAESDTGIAVQDSASSVADPAGARAWREQIAQALLDGRVRLAEEPVLGNQGQLLHLLCPVHVQLVPGGPYHAAAGWLALARRSRLLPRVDLATLDLALQAIARDGQARAVHLAWLSLTVPGFMADVAVALAAAPQAARLLHIEWGDDDASAAHESVAAEATALWRPWGVQLGVEHAGAMAQHPAHLAAVGLQYVRFDGRHVRGVAQDAAVHAYAQSLAALVHGQGLQALAAGVDDMQDLMALWALGFDGASGVAVQGAAINGSAVAP